ncbi:hypothetical protein F4823DRAFT_22985 [Ustulina deusta]|nr:hypothetical protein F4823DRAFT_22985 [Ustulina deusta]
MPRLFTLLLSSEDVYAHVGCLGVWVEGLTRWDGCSNAGRVSSKVAQLLETIDETRMDLTGASRGNPSTSSGGDRLCHCDDLDTEALPLLKISAF